MAQLIEDKRRSGKIHISHPKRNQVIASPNSGNSINLQGVGATTVYKSIKVVLHNFEETNVTVLQKYEKFGIYPAYPSDYLQDKQNNHVCP